MWFIMEIIGFTQFIYYFVNTFTVVIFCMGSCLIVNLKNLIIFEKLAVRWNLNFKSIMNTTNIFLRCLRFFPLIQKSQKHNLKIPAVKKNGIHAWLSKPNEPLPFSSSNKHSGPPTANTHKTHSFTTQSQSEFSN